MHLQLLPRTVLLLAGAPALVHALSFSRSNSPSRALVNASSADWHSTQLDKSPAPWAPWWPSWPARRPHPVVVWHGLGDSGDSPGMLEFADALRDAYPGIFVHNVVIDPAADRRASLFGLVNDQIAEACDQLSSLPELSGGFDAIGFSQGGQFLRAYVERCNTPPVRNLVTFGSQHMGIVELPRCASWDVLCRAALAGLRGRINTEYAQNHIVPAQYFRNPRTWEDYDGYLQHNRFLLDVNNEVVFNETYKQRLSTLHNFVMVVFSDDQAVVPRESGWFASYPVAEEDEQLLLVAGDGGKFLSAGATTVSKERFAGEQVPSSEQVPVMHTSGAEASRNDMDPFDEQSPLVPLRQSPLYLQDLLGLRTLDRWGGLIMETCRGEHMVIDAGCQIKILGRWVGSPKSNVLEWLWYPSGVLLNLVGIHGGSWIGPLFWPRYTFTILPDGLHRLGIDPARFGNIQPVDPAIDGDDDPIPVPHIDIDYTLSDLALLAAVVLAILFILRKTLMMVLSIVLAVITLPAGMVLATLALPVAALSGLIATALYIPYIIISSFIDIIMRRRAGNGTQTRGPALLPPYEHPPTLVPYAQPHVPTGYGSLLSRYPGSSGIFIPAGTGDSYVHRPARDPRESPVPQPFLVDIESRPPSYAEVGPVFAAGRRF